jgi:hypothetical protein
LIAANGGLYRDFHRPVRHVNLEQELTMDDRKAEAMAPLESVLRTEQLHQRCQRPPDYETERRILVSKHWLIRLGPFFRLSPTRFWRGCTQAQPASASLPKRASDLTERRLRANGRGLSAVARRAMFLSLSPAIRRGDTQAVRAAVQVLALKAALNGYKSSEMEVKVTSVPSWSSV